MFVGLHHILQRPVATICWIGLLCCVLAACEDTFIDPFENDGKYYTIYGYLDESRPANLLVPHEVRVIPVSRFPERITSPLHPQADIDAKVFSRDLDAVVDTTIEWKHALVQLDDGLFAHVFRAVFPAVPGHRYRLEVHRSDGVVSWAETTVPSLSTVVPEPSNLRVVDDSSTILQDIVLPGRVFPWEIQVSYDVGGRDCQFDRGVTTPLPYGQVGDATPEGWRFTVNISDDIGRLSTSLQRSDIFFCSMGLRIRALDTAWQLPESRNPDVIALPGTFTNVTNGYGYFGSVGVLRYDWPISQELINLIDEDGGI